MLKLVKLEEKYMPQLIDMMDEWYAAGEKIVPYAIRKVDYHDFTAYVESLESKEAVNGLVPDSTFFCLDTERNIFVGAVNIRHYLNDVLLLHGGHIGDGVRPSERRKGVATVMIGLALQECCRLGIERVLMVCDKENVGSAKSIRNNGGILENEVEADGITEQRYWIDLQPPFVRLSAGPGSLEQPVFVVTVSKYRGRTLMSRHRERSTWECQGGHIESGETPLEAAKRELYEESGALEYDIRPVCDYWTGNPRTGEVKAGMLFAAEIKKLGPIPESEMAEVREFAELPDNLTYPEIMPALYRAARDGLAK